MQEKQVQRKENKKKMFDRLEDLLIRFEEIMSELNEPFVVNDQTRFQKLMKEQSDLQPIVDTYREYKKNKETIQRTAFPCWKKSPMKRCEKCSKKN